jgi:hypothetical protein
MADKEEWQVLQKNFNRLYDEMEDMVYDFIADQECDTQEKWDALMASVDSFDTWEFEKELYESCITRKMEQWIDEQEGMDTLTQKDDFKLEVPKKEE